MAKLQQVAWDMWTYRNGLIHQPDHVWKIQRSNQLNQYIRTEYERGTVDLERSDLSLFRRDLQFMFSLSTDKKELWLQSVQVARNRYHVPQGPRHRLPPLPVERARMARWIGIPQPSE